MENKHATYSPSFHLISWIALIGGIVTYLVGLWNADMQLNEKGYYFAVLVLGLFAAASYQKTVRDKYEAIPTTALYYTTCLVVFVIAVGLLGYRTVECHSAAQRERVLWAGVFFEPVWRCCGTEKRA